MIRCSFFFAFLLANTVQPSALGQRSECLITIFIHGTLKPAEFSFSTISKLMRNKIENSLYAISLEFIRANTYIFQGSPMQGLGLVPIETSEKSDCAGAQVLKNLFEVQYTLYDTTPTCRKYYTFGWNGRLSDNDRYLAARTLYDALEKEVTQLQSNGVEPRIQLIAYSHGGNVALHLATVKSEKKSESPFCIDQLVLLATPVQKQTDYLIKDTHFFKSIFSFYSTEDHIQASDIFTNKRQLHSRKLFKNNRRFRLPDTLTQVQIRLIKDIKRSSFFDSDDATPEKIFQERSIRCIHKDPSHTEFWNLAWGNYWYRAHSPLYPLPVVALVPAIIHALQQHTPHARSVVFDYCPKINGARIIDKKQNCFVAAPILNKTIIEAMKQTAIDLKPYNFSLEEQYHQEQQALKKAYEVLQKDKCKQKPSRRRCLKTSYFELSRKIWVHQLPQF